MENTIFNVTYQKSYGRNHMILEPMLIDEDSHCIEQLKRDFRFHMIKENTIDGLLHTHIQFTDSIPSFYYDISGFQSLKVILDSTPLGYELLCKIFLGLHNALLSIEKYMLLYEQLVLDINYIFLSSDYSKVYFCYYPLLTQDFCLSTRQLFDELLKDVDHTDEKCVFLAYSMHKDSLKEDFNVHKLLSCLSTVPSDVDTPTISPVPAQPDTIREDINYNARDVHSTSPVHSDIMATFDKDSSRFLIKVVCLALIGIFAFGIVTTLFFLDFYDFRFYLILLAIIVIILGYNGYMVYFLNAPSKLSSLVASSAERTTPSYSKKTLDVSSTVLLTPVADDCIYKLIYTGADQRHDIDLKSFPFIIGKNETCDSYISAPTVSRIHAKIDQAKDAGGLQSLFIEDLNSTNGTLLNNILLNPYEKVPLSPGDHISFGGITYMLR